MGHPWFLKKCSAQTNHQNESDFLIACFITFVYMCLLPICESFLTWKVWQRLNPNFQATPRCAQSSLLTVGGKFFRTLCHQFGRVLPQTRWTRPANPGHGIHWYTPKKQRSLFIKVNLVRKLPSYGRWSWLAFTPSCQPHYHVNPVTNSWEA